MNPAQTSQCTGTRPYSLLSRLKNSPSCWTNEQEPSSSYLQPWYLHTNWRHEPLDSSRGKSVHTSLLPRWGHTLWNARTFPDRIQHTAISDSQTARSLGELE